MIKQKTRNEIDDKYKWDLTAIFKNDEEFLNELEKCKDMNTTWTKDDIINALVEDGIEPTNANIVKVITAEFVQNFKDRIIELGNEMISWQVSDVFKKKGE